jgi:tetratricopeptide (TPR) repeat protein
MDVKVSYQGKVLFDAEKDHDAIIGMCTADLAKKPDDYSALAVRGAAYRKKGDYKKALADFTRMIDLEPGNPCGWNCRGSLYQKLEKHDKAIADFTRCIPLSDEGDGDAWSNRGISYCKKGDFEAALADLTKSLECEADPERTDQTLVWRGTVWLQTGKMHRAFKDFMLAHDRNPKNCDALYHLSYICSVRRDFDKAIEYISKALAQREYNGDYWLVRGGSYWNKCLLSGTNFWGEGNEMMTFAENDFTRAIECSPNLAEAYFFRGEVRCAKAHDSNSLIKSVVLGKANAEVERLIMLAELESAGGKDLVPDVDIVLRGLRSGRDQAGMFVGKIAGLLVEKYADEAIKDLSRAIALAPDLADAYYKRGLVYALLGKADKARADYKKTCALDPTNREAAEKLTSWV